MGVKVSPWLPHAAWLFGTRVFLELMLGGLPVSSWNLLQDANPVANAAFLFAGVAHPSDATVAVPISCQALRLHRHDYLQGGYKMHLAINLCRQNVAKSECQLLLASFCLINLLQDCWMLFEVSAVRCYRLPRLMPVSAVCTGRTQRTTGAETAAMSKPYLVALCVLRRPQHEHSHLPRKQMTRVCCSSPLCGTWIKDFEQKMYFLCTC